MASEETTAVIKILIVDDEQDICYFLSRNLSEKGYATSFSNSLAEASLRLKQDPPDLLLLDNHLPDGKGVEFARDINEKYPSIKVVMITAHDSPQDRSRAYGNGISFFLSKPFTMASVNQVVELVINNR